MRKRLLPGLFRKILLFFTIPFILFCVGTSILWAQDATSSTITPDQVNEIARNLWCPLCSGVRLDSCELQACLQMKQVIAIKLEQGEDLESIRAYFYEQYGPQVLGEPPREGFSWLAWILPFAALIGGGFLMWSRMRMLVKSPAESAVAATSANHEVGVSDEDAAKLQEELKRYG